jgi:hypothetical protein
LVVSLSEGQLLYHNKNILRRRLADPLPRYEIPELEFIVIGHDLDSAELAVGLEIFRLIED